MLKAPTKPKRHVYKPLESLTIKHWKENTTIEPVLHRRKAHSDDRETIPARYQCLTDK